MKGVTLEKNGLSANLWRWFYNNEDLPVSYCTFFWSRIVAAMFALPFFVLYFPAKVVNWFFLASDYERKPGFWKCDIGRVEGSWGSRFCISLFFYIAVLGVAFYFYAGAALFFGFNDSAAHAFIMITVILAIIGIGVLIAVGMSSDPIIEKRESLSLAVDSFMNKYCPKITWTNDDTDQ